MSSKQSAHQRAPNRSGGYLSSVENVRIDKPTNRRERRLRARTLARGTAILTVSPQQGSTITADVVHSAHGETMCTVPGIETPGEVLPLPGND